jgi:hypothetical protein
MKNEKGGLPPPHLVTELNSDHPAYKTIMQAREDQKQAHIEGLPALKRLFEAVQGHSGQCRYVARFLLGLYNGTRFPFDMTNFRAIDRELSDDCFLVLRMDRCLLKEVHQYFEDGGKRFEAMAKRWGVLDVRQLQEQAHEAGIEVFGE